ncbi:MAG: hypothetical protein V1933_07970 [Candidatus Omnitrophota bacterium]
MSNLDESFDRLDSSLTKLEKSIKRLKIITIITTALLSLNIILQLFKIL